MTPETAPPRQGEHPDTKALIRWLQTDVTISQFPGGHSNLTYLIVTPAGEMVLRRPPLGPIAAKAHDMAREYRLLSALHSHFPLAPRPLRLCEDLSVLGCPFFLMERRRGKVLRGQSPAVEDRPAFSRAFVTTLAALHDVDTADPAVAALGRPDGFLARQVLGWSDRWLRVQQVQAPEIDKSFEWLGLRTPKTQSAALIHNDFKLDNLMFDPIVPGLPTAVLDWEMATLGDPLFDLGVALTYWCHAPRSAVGLGLCTTEPGWWSRDEMVHAYASLSGRDVSVLGWHELLGVCKLAVILQQIYVRWQNGQTSDERFAGFGEMVLELGATAARLREQIN